MEFCRYSPASDRMVTVDIQMAPLSNNPNVIHLSSPRIVGVAFISDSLSDLQAIKHTWHHDTQAPVLGIHCAQESHQYSVSVRSPKTYLKRTPDWYAIYWGLIGIEESRGRAIASDLIECYMDATKPKVNPVSRRISAITIHGDTVELLVWRTASRLVNDTKPWRHFR